MDGTARTLVTEASPGESLDRRKFNHKGVLADTIFHAILNVETGLWNVSQPDLSEL